MTVPYSAQTRGAVVPVPRTGVERATLVRRTYGLVFLGIITTMIGSAVALSQQALLAQSAQHPIITFLLFFGTLFAAQAVRRRFPLNIALTLLATFIAGVMIAPALFVYNRMQPGIVGQAALLTFTTFGVLSLYATFSRRDFSAWGGFFMIGVIVLLVTSLLNLWFKNETASLWLAAGTVFIFGGLLVFDTWRIVRSNQYGPDDYVPAAVNIYVDLLNIFLAILRLLGGRRS
jgi:FtsH-binding integral membrane protein